MAHARFSTPSPVSSPSMLSPPAAPRRGHNRLITRPHNLHRARRYSSPGCGSTRPVSSWEEAMMLDEEDVYMMEGELEYMGDDEEDIDIDENDKDREEMDVQFETEKGRVKPQHQYKQRKVTPVPWNVAFSSSPPAITSTGVTGNLRTILETNMYEESGWDDSLRRLPVPPTPRLAKVRASVLVSVHASIISGLFPSPMGPGYYMSTSEQATHHETTHQGAAFFSHPTTTGDSSQYSSSPAVFSTASSSNGSLTFVSSPLTRSSKRSHEQLVEDEGDGNGSGMSKMGSSSFKRLKVATNRQTVQ
ncbi:hypothetical protein HDK90DRAFT_463490 [Phyllosticta capitalensis]|uniref:Uncharacterized protein n=1 Tax=Phyllosticta capitalensis TaxID=121624 RepID=A0ABR1Z1E1_9PEZI